LIYRRNTYRRPWLNVPLPPLPPPRLAPPPATTGARITAAEADRTPNQQGRSYLRGTGRSDGIFELALPPWAAETHSRAGITEVDTSRHDTGAHVLTVKWRDTAGAVQGGARATAVGGGDDRDGGGSDEGFGGGQGTHRREDHSDGDDGHMKRRGRRSLLSPGLLCRSDRVRKPPPVASATSLHALHSSPCLRAGAQNQHINYVAISSGCERTGGGSTPPAHRQDS
jgi:hypothetical protein